MPENDTVSCLAGSWTVNTISDQCDAFLLAYRNAQSLCIDLGGVEDFDLTFLQLLEAARICAAQEGKKIQLISAAKGALLEELEQAGFLHDGAARAFWLCEEAGS